MAVHLKPSDSRRVPWKNGRGTTLEVASDARDGAPWSWRLSIADVPESGPFSRFEGCERLILGVEGRGMQLIIEGRAMEVPFAGAALRFSGDVDSVGALRDGPCRDINLMVRRNAWDADLTMIRGTHHAQAGGVDGRAIVHVLDGESVVTEANGVGHDLAAGETLIVRDATIAIAVRGVVALASLTARR